MFNIGSSNVGDFINYCLVIPIGKDVHDYFTISLVSLVEFKVNSKLITKVCLVFFNSCLAEKNIRQKCLTNTF